jgi:hypothetical protein
LTKCSKPSRLLYSLTQLFGTLPSLFINPTALDALPTSTPTTRVVLRIL